MNFNVKGSRSVKLQINLRSTLAKLFLLTFAISRIIFFFNGTWSGYYGFYSMSPPMHSRAGALPNQKMILNDGFIFSRDQTIVCYADVFDIISNRNPPGITNPFEEKQNNLPTTQLSKVKSLKLLMLRN